MILSIFGDPAGKSRRFWTAGPIKRLGNATIFRIAAVLDLPYMSEARDLGPGRKRGDGAEIDPSPSKVDGDALSRYGVLTA